MDGDILMCGARRDRTDDLLNAIQALSQLSYSPAKSADTTPGVFFCQRLTTPLLGVNAPPPGVDAQFRIHTPWSCNLFDSGAWARAIL